ncbi:endonuclease/exonuclease/phosphatase family protein [Streptomyces sp. JL2001]|uniref:endonuclease/exonuclease/phosphatase family protein n=1 Tax=Streptomyces sp. JL2001 TaxID=3342488 RepID=UPI003D8008B0
MRGFRTARLAAAGVLFAVMLPAATAQAETASPTSYNVWQWNVAGNTFHGGRSDTNMVSLAASSIVYRNADFVAFNELCKGQFDELVRQLAATNWPQVETNFARFEPSRQANTGVCGGAAFGNAIFSKRPLGTADRIPLADDGNTLERRNMLCAPLTDGSGVRFCTTHLTTVDSFKWTQLGEINQKLEAWSAAGEKVLISGDFNVEPDYPSMNSFYAATANTPHNGGNVGAYRELDDNDAGNCPGYGEPTSNTPPSPTNPTPCGGNQKIDLILVRESALAAPGSYSADALTTSKDCTPGSKNPDGLCSDHRILTGTVTLR